MSRMRQGLIPAALRGFSPLDIDNLHTWLDFSDYNNLYTDSAKTTLVGSDGDVIGAAADKSGNDNDVTQATSADKPTWKTGVRNGLAVARFGGGHYLQGAFGTALSQPYHVFVVAKKDAAVVNDDSVNYLIDGDDGTNRMRFLGIAAPTPDEWSFGAGTVLTSGVGDDSNWNIHIAKANSTSSSYRINGDTKANGDAGTDNADGITIGAREDGLSLWDGDICEILIYDPSLSTSDRQKIESWLSRKWDIAI